MLKIHLWKTVAIFGVKYFKEPEKKVRKNKVEYCEKDEQQWPPCGDQGPSRGTLGRGDHVLDGREEKVHIWASSIRDLLSMLAWYFSKYTLEFVHYYQKVVFIDNPTFKVVCGIPWDDVNQHPTSDGVTDQGDPGEDKLFSQIWGPYVSNKNWFCSQRLAGSM